MNDSVRADISGSSSLRSPEPVPVSALPGNDPGRGAAPPAYQAEVLRQQVCDDVNRRFWRARRRVVRAFEDHKDRVQRDYEKLSAHDFLAKYENWRFL